MTKILVLLILLPSGILSAFNIIKVFSDFFQEIDLIHYFFVGGTIFSIYIVSKYKKKLEFFSTFEHELTHNIWAMLFLKKPMGFHVNTDGSGLFEYQSGVSGGKFSEIFISLSPYFFPTACYLWLPFHVMCKEEYYWFYFLMMGIFFGYQVMSTIQETGFYQSDIQLNGILYSYLTFIPLYIIFHGIIIAHLNNGFAGISDFLYYDNVDNMKYLIDLIN